jgi:hypothetical protein
MKRFRNCFGWSFLTLLLAAIGGCGGSMPATSKTALAAKPEGAKVRPPAAPSAAIGPSKPAAGAKPAKKLSLNPFQMPEIPEEFLPPKEEPVPLTSTAPIKQVERPKLRLLGFSKVDGVKALVELNGDVQAVQPGDVIEGVQVVSVEPPNVTFQFTSSRWVTKLFDQPWHNEQTGVASSPGASRAFASQSRSSQRPSITSSTTRAPVAATIRIPTGPSLLGSTIGAGIPGIGGSAVPGMPSGNDGGGVPAIPGIPSTGTTGTSGMPGGGGAIPGGAGGLPGGFGGLPGGAGAMPGGAGAMPGGTGGMPGGAGGMPGGGMPRGAGGMPGGIN